MLGNQENIVKDKSYYISKFNVMSSESLGFLQDKLGKYSLEQLANIHKAAVQEVKINRNVGGNFFFDRNLELAAVYPETIVAVRDTLRGKGEVERDRLYTIIEKLGINDEILANSYRNLVQKIYLRDPVNPTPRNSTEGVNKYISSEDNITVIENILKNPDTFNGVVEILDDPSLYLAESGKDPAKLLKMISFSMKSDNPIAMAKGIKIKIEELNIEIEGKWFGKDSARQKLVDSIYSGEIIIEQQLANQEFIG